MKPILSRFCEIYVSEPIVNGNIINLYKFNLNKTFDFSDFKVQREDWLKKEILKNLNEKSSIQVVKDFCLKLYEKGYSGLDVINLVENQKFLENKLDFDKRYELLLCFNRIKKEFRNEKLLMFFIFNFIFLDSVTPLENISFL